MQTIIKKQTGESAYLMNDDVEVSITFKEITLGNPNEPDLIILDLNLDNSLVLAEVTPPADWEANKYRVENGEWIDITPERKIAEQLAKLELIRTQRAAEYPPMADYLDGIVKGDQAQVQAYIDACLAVKAKYPKPTV